VTVLHLMAGLGDASGVANIARRFARAQRERGDEALLLAPGDKWNPIYFAFAFAVRAWRQAQLADAIWVHCSWTFPVWYGAWLARHFRKRLVVVPEGSFDPLRMNNHAGWKKRLVRPLDRWVLRRAGTVLALCPDEVGWVRSFEPNAKVRFECVPTFIRAADFMSPRGRNSPLRVLFLGRAEDPLKGVRYLRQAVDELNRGNAVGSLVELRVESKVFREAKEAAWNWCDVFCLPTLSENFGLVVAEALEHGKPVVTTDGASAWAGLPPEQGVYLVGYREGSDAERVKLLRDALGRMDVKLKSEDQSGME